ncbi:MAG: ABC transporter ATP-binding protein [Bacilli bacterium]|nr:ABC transporter ATP-binding protein [Bacilli bacterium]MBN2696530.1 ABC transporter ATP-binding protein [Bacilli bacterium]
MNPILQVDNISKTFRLSRKQQKIEVTKEKLKVAVNGLSFGAYKGEIYGLLGPNGAGKTTALRCISTLIKPDSGEVTINGHSVTKEEDKVRGEIGFLTSDLKLEEFFTPNYQFDYFSKLHGVSEETMKQRKKILFEKFGIDKFAEVKVGELSTGMRQKVQIAIALVHDPDIIVFDEPTNGLDVLTAKVVTDYLKELRDSGKTIIISTHIFRVAERLCDRVGIIVDGTMCYEAEINDDNRDSIDLESLLFKLVEESEAMKNA